MVLTRAHSTTFWRLIPPIDRSLPWVVLVLLVGSDGDSFETVVLGLPPSARVTPVFGFRLSVESVLLALFFFGVCGSALRSLYSCWGLSVACGCNLKGSNAAGQRDRRTYKYGQRPPEQHQTGGHRLDKLLQGQGRAENVEHELGHHLSPLGIDDPCAEAQAQIIDQRQHPVESCSEREALIVLYI